MKNFTFFVSYYEAIKELPVEKQGIVYKAVIEYAMEGIEPNLTGLAKSIFILIKPYLDSQKRNSKNGSKGGAPKGNSNAKKANKNNLGTTEKQARNNQNLTQDINEPTTEKTTNIVHEEEYKYKQEKEYEYLFVNNNACACVREEEREPYKKFFNETFDYYKSGDFYDSAIEVIDTMIEVRKNSLSGEFKFNHKTYDEDELLQIYINLDNEKFRKIVTQVTLNKEIVDKPRYIMGCILNLGLKPSVMNTEAKINQFKECLKSGGD